MAVVLVFLMLALLSPAAQAFTLIEAMLLLFTSQCFSPASQGWTQCLTNNTCQDGFSVGAAAAGSFAELVRERPSSHHYLYSYGDGSTQTRATMRISSRDLEDLVRWRTHSLETKQPMKVDLEGRWQLKRADESLGGSPGRLEFQFGRVDDTPTTPTGLICVTAVYKN